MPTTATLLLREDSSTSLTSLVEKSQQRKPPFLEYDLQLTPTHLGLIARSPTPIPVVSPTPNGEFNSKPNAHADEGFESDVDTVSIVSSDGSFAPETGSKTTETDSANGSASSDSDTENSERNKTPGEPPTTTTTTAADTAAQKIYISDNSKESFNLVDCVCYTDAKSPDILVFVIKQEALVFRLTNLNNLKSFYLNFTALKAVANQKTYNQNASAKFNLLQRTDSNGVTHIEITREPEANLFVLPREGPTSIISLNTPENKDRSRLLTSLDRDRSKTLNTRNLTNRAAASDRDGRYKDVGSKQRDHIDFRSSSDNILNLVNSRNDRPAVNNAGSAVVETSLRKVWNSAEDLLSAVPKRPERRKKLKGRAPLPPAPPPSSSPTTPVTSDIQDVLRGEYVRVNVNIDASKDRDFIAKGQLKERKPPSSSSKSNLVTLFASKPKLEAAPLLQRTPLVWTNSVPRLLKKPRSKSETRTNFTPPMAYRYIDAVLPPTYSSQMNNRLFGLSPKLREFNGQDSNRWGGSSGTSADQGGHLKSVIKKDENHRKKNEKKVTFSAYTTVQVV